MIVGVIRTRDILMHPLTVISMRGFGGFFKILYRALNRKPQTFINMIENTQWIYTNNKK